MKNKNLSSVVLYSIVAAAFIGPGTITTAATAGSRYQLQLLWAVAFSILACVIIKEIAARLTLASGLTIGEAIEKKFGAGSGYWIKILIGGTVILGCAAYEAGNILGAVSGIELLAGGDTRIYTLIVCFLAAIILWSEKRKILSRAMTFFVLLMGVAFLSLALNSTFSMSEILVSLVNVKMLPGSELIALGLVGTTIVPYNLFIASGIGAGQTIKGMRVGLITSIVVGGSITATILLAGTVVNNFTSFSELYQYFKTQTGDWGAIAFALGLFAAGFSSAITAPYAASLIARTVFGSERKIAIRSSWIIVLATGLVMGLSGAKPIPVILTVQALNGFILPLITFFLILLVNDPGIVPQQHRHASYYNSVLTLLLGVMLLLGLNNLDGSISTFLNLASKSHLDINLLICIIAMAGTAFLLLKKQTTRP